MEATPAGPAGPPGSRPPEIVDWRLAARIAHRFAGRPPIADSYLGASLGNDFDAVTTEAEALVADFTGLRAPGEARAAVLDRPAWIDVNVVSMRRLLRPLSERVGARLARSPAAPLGRGVAAAELGVLLGYVSRRVLGQYDLVVGDPDDGVGVAGDSAGDTVFYVGANVLELEKRFAFRPLEFRRWIALHEVTHRAQFTGVPWLRGHFLDLVGRVLAVAAPDPRRLVRALGRAADDVRAGRNPLDDGGLVGLLATDDQRALLDEVQALMALLEGHGNLVMNGLGRVHVAGQGRMSAVLQARRAAGGWTGAIQKALGLELKMSQYRLGEEFCEAVVLEAGPRGLDPVWRAPAMLPTLDELSHPTRWLERVDGPGAPGAPGALGAVPGGGTA
ncbi:MAG: zinc-dependent metalloprotease [Acidimicrobiia bacterium]|nr:zinc-dependent metalloprotease [Acidimicrobiia bacterium]